MRKIAYILTLALLFMAVKAEAQMTRGQLLRKYYQITQLHNSGKDAEAIALCEEITAMYPKLPDTYLRMAQIYDEGGEQELALLMYRTYASLEMDDKKLAEVNPRMKELEGKLGAKSLEEQEKEQFDKLMAETPNQSSGLSRSPSRNPNPNLSLNRSPRLQRRFRKRPKA